MKSPLHMYDEASQRTIGILGTKHGIGATTAALAIASLSDKNPLVIDGNIKHPKVHRHLGILPMQPSFEPLSFNFHEFLHKHPLGFSVIAQHASVNEHPAGASHVELLFNEAKNNHALILVPHTVHADSSNVIRHMNEVLFVTDSSHESISRLSILKELANSQKQTILGVVLSKAKSPVQEKVADYIERTTGLTVIGNIPQDNDVINAYEAYTPVTHYRANSPAAQNYYLLSRKIL